MDDSQVVIVFFDGNKEVIHFYVTTRSKIEMDVKSRIALLREECGPDPDGQELKIDYCVWDAWFASEMSDYLDK